MSVRHHRHRLALRKEPMTSFCIHSLARSEKKFQLDYEGDFELRNICRNPMMPVFVRHLRWPQKRFNFRKCARSLFYQVINTTWTIEIVRGNALNRIWSLLKLPHNLFTRLFCTDHRCRIDSQFTTFTFNFTLLPLTVHPHSTAAAAQERFLLFSFPLFHRLGSFLFIAPYKLNSAHSNQLIYTAHIMTVRYWDLL